MATEVLVPPLGQTVDSVTLVAWHRSEGESIERGEMLFAIETDKATLDIEAPASGVLRRVTARPGDEVGVLSAIGLIAQPGEAVEPKQVNKKLEGAVPSPTSKVSTDRDRSGVLPHRAADRVLISPRARRLAAKHGVALTALKPTGPEGAIIERDVRDYVDVQIEQKDPAVAGRIGRDAGLNATMLPSDGPRAVKGGTWADRELLETIPVRGRRAIIAERMTRSSAATARVTLNAEADASALVDARRRLAEDGVAVSFNALLMQIVARSLRDHPRLNSSLVGDAIQVWRRVHVGLAVDSDRGLLVPVVRDVDRKGLTQIEGEIRSLTEQARAGQSSPPVEPSVGTFTLTNLGMYGIDSFTPVINLPECAILGVGRIKKQPTIEAREAVVQRSMWLSVSFDHRLVDGAPAARFLQRVVQLVERPYLLLI